MARVKLFKIIKINKLKILFKNKRFPVFWEFQSTKNSQKKLNSELISNNIIDLKNHQIVLQMALVIYKYSNDITLLTLIHSKEIFIYKQKIKI